MKHGHAARGHRSSEYSSWSCMRNRVLCPTDVAYKYYGARGITICGRWSEFVAFLKDMGPKPFKGATLERKDNNGNYCPSNCIWASRAVQQNNRRCCIFLTHNGVTLTLAQWGKRNGVTNTRISARMRRGMSAQEAVFTPVIETPRGEQSACSKLSEPEVRQIYALAHEGSLTYKEIAAQFSVSPSLVCAIISRRIWRHLTLGESTKVSA